MNPLPDRCDVALKEWAGVCRALIEGRQTLLARKGGIREREGRFTPEHETFWLYPTGVHQAQQGLREPNSEPGSTGPHDPVRIDGLAKVQWVEYLRSEDVLPVLEPFHVWTPETIRKRFRYRSPGLWVLAVRVFRRPEPWTLVPTSDQLGCVSWVTLEAGAGTEGLRPVLDDTAAAERLAELRSALDACRGPAT